MGRVKTYAMNPDIALIGTTHNHKPVPLKMGKLESIEWKDRTRTFTTYVDKLAKKKRDGKFKPKKKNCLKRGPKPGSTRKPKPDPDYN